MSKDWLHRIAPHVHRAGRATGRRVEDWFDPDRALYDHELLLFGPGSDCTISTRDRRYACGPRSFVVIPPGLWHRCEGSTPADGLRAWVHFDWQRAADEPWDFRLTYAPAAVDPRALRTAPRWVPSGILHGLVARFDRAADAHQRLCRALESGDPHQQLVARALALELLLECLGPQPDPTATPSADPLDTMQRALIEIAEQPFRDAPAIRAVIAAQGQSYDHLARRFKAAVGVTPLQHVNGLRMQRARRLLRDTELSVGAIAQRLGFDSAAYLSRLYRQVHGIAPSDDRAD